MKLAKTGPVILAGDLYHYPAEFTDRTFDPYGGKSSEMENESQGGNLTRSSRRLERNYGFRTILPFQHFKDIASVLRMQAYLEKWQKLR